MFCRIRARRRVFSQTLRTQTTPRKTMEKKYMVIPHAAVHPARFSGPPVALVDCFARARFEQ